MTEQSEALVRCHCGKPVYVNEALDGFTRGLCENCDSVRCDAYPGACVRPDTYQMAQDDPVARVRGVGMTDGNEAYGSVDPTAIPIEFDPHEQRMRGVAYHGNTPFDVPFISKITDDLWQGGCTNGLRLPREVKHVVSLYPWEQYDVRHNLQSTLSVRLYDSLDGPESAQMVALATWINVCRKTGVTLVHCQAGLNRSGLLAGLALVLEGRTADEAITLLRETRSPAVLCNPVFEAWLRGFEAASDV